MTCCHLQRFLALLVLISILLLSVPAGMAETGGGVRKQPAGLLSGEAPVHREAGLSSMPGRAHAEELPVPLPHECGGSTGPCCIYGYVYVEGWPVEGAEVQIASRHGVLSTTTAPGWAAPDAYFQASLSAAPLSAGQGDTITITAAYAGMVVTRTWTVVDGGQQVDIGFPLRPARRTFHGWAYDSIRRRAVLFGGWDGVKPIGDTWEFDGTNWQHIETPQSPAPRLRFGMTYDSGRHRVVLFGGVGDGGVLYGDTWEYDGTTWYQVATVHTPGSRADPGLAYDASRGRVVLFGGTAECSQPPYSVLGDTWEYDGNDWHPISPAASPPGRTGRDIMVYDSQRQRVILHGGWTGAGCSDETWEYNGFDWTLWAEGGPLRQAHALTYDGNRGRAILYGGRGCSQPIQETWEYNPVTAQWANVPANANPNAYSAPLLYDADSQRVLLFGGSSIAGPLDELWQYNGDWALVPPARPQVAFSAAPVSGTAPLDVQFVDQTSGQVVAWTWNLGDGTVDGARHPAHTYGVAGAYSVSLTVSGPGGSAFGQVTGYITVRPPVFLPPLVITTTIVPQWAVQGLDVIHFAGAGRDQDEGGCCIVAYDWHSDRQGFLSGQAVFDMPASRLAAGTHQITFRVLDDEGQWSAPASLPLHIEPSIPGSVRTLVLFNYQRMAALYGTDRTDEVRDRLDLLRPYVAGLIVSVENDPITRDAYAAWDAAPGDQLRANAVAAAIKAQVVNLWTAHPSLEYLVIVGDDRIVPFRRVPDCTSYPESHYGLVAITTTVGAAIHADMTLTDDYYGDLVPTVLSGPPWNGHELYLPDLGIGRLVETPEEIVAQIDALVTNSERTVDSAAVSGYSLVADGAQAICDRLQDDAIFADCTLIGEGWGHDEWVSKMLDTHRDLIAASGHASHVELFTPMGDSVNATEIAATSGLSGTLVYAAGCHAGLNVPEGAADPLDLAQAMSRREATYIANTGYGWAYQSSMGLTERLLFNLTDQLTWGVSSPVGTALAAAKRQYYLEEGEFDCYDEKILLESTLYGLPMVRYDTPFGETQFHTQQGTGSFSLERQPTTLAGLTPWSLTVYSITLVPASTPDGVYYTYYGQAQAGRGKPVQPAGVFYLSMPPAAPHGAIFRGGDYHEIGAFDPVVERFVTGTTGLSEPMLQPPTWYPAVPSRLNNLEQQGSLVVSLGQFNAGQQVERLYDTVRFDIYFHDSSDDWTAPSLQRMESVLGPGLVTVTVWAADPSGLYAVVVPYDNGIGRWQSVALAGNGSMRVGSFPGDGHTQFFVQAVDRAGNAAVLDNRSRYFHPGEGWYTAYLPIVGRE